MKLFKLLFIFCLSFYILACNNKSATLFKKISFSHSGITFNNKITESDSINPLNVVNIYNGGGVGIGDFNNDGLQDIFFTGNMVPCKLYINKGDFQFEDITGKAGVDGLGRWARGVSIVDINNDGLMDIYICNTIYKDSLRNNINDPALLYRNTTRDNTINYHFLQIKFRGSKLNRNGIGVVVSIMMATGTRPPSAILITTGGKIFMFRMIFCRTIFFISIIMTAHFQIA